MKKKDKMLITITKFLDVNLVPHRRRGNKCWIKVCRKACDLVSVSFLITSMAGTGSGPSPSTPSVRTWRTAFLTLRDETLTLPPRSSVAQLLHNLIFSHSHALMSAIPELPSHEVFFESIIDFQGLFVLFFFEVCPLLWFTV